MYLINNKEYKCSIDIVQDIFNDNWKLKIIWYLLKGERRYKELNEEINEISQKTLTIKLRELEEKNIINRECFPEIPPKVVYSLSDVGESLRPILNSMFDWGVDYVSKYGEFLNKENCELKN